MQAQNHNVRYQHYFNTSDGSKEAPIVRPWTRQRESNVHTLSSASEIISFNTYVGALIEHNDKSFNHQLISVVEIRCGGSNLKCK